MKKYLLILSFFLFGYSQIASADWARYTAVQLDSYNATQTQCMNAAIRAGKTAGFPKIKKQRNTETQVTAKNQEGYTIQFICFAYKKIAFFIINGSSSTDENRKKREQIYNTFYNNFKKQL